MIDERSLLLLRTTPKLISMVTTVSATRKTAEVTSTSFFEIPIYQFPLR